MYRKLLVPLDGSTFSEQALTFACDIAQRSGAKLHLVHVHTFSNIIYVAGMPVIDAELQSLAQEHERAYLEQIRERLTATTELSITCANLDSEGSVASTLGQYIEAHAIDLVVMTTHGRGGLERAWLGSVADALVRCSLVPLLLLRPGEHAPDIVQPPQLKRILIPLDGSALSEHILSPALELGRLMGAEYTLLRAAEPFVMVGYAPLAQASRVDLKMSQAGLDEAQRYLDRVAARLHAEGAAIRTRALQAAHPAVAILEEAHRQGADLIAMTTHGRSGIARLLLGSVADKVLRGAALPMLIQRPRS
jgi:nucleotide-binding universal stress UspA family protein